MGLFDWLKKKEEPAKNKKEATNALETALQKAVSDPASRPEFYKLLLSEELIVLTAPDQLREGAYTLSEGTKINLVTLDDGRIPLFTSTDRIFDKQVIKEQVPYLAAKGADLLGFAKGAPLVLNPFSDYGKDLLSAEVDDLLKGILLKPNHQTITYKKDTRVLLGQPAEYPEKMVKALSSLFADIPAIKKAYLAMKHEPDSDQTANLIIALDMEALDQGVINQTGEMAYQYMDPNDFLDLMVIEPGTGMSDYFVNSVTPFFVRGDMS